MIIPLANRLQKVEEYYFSKKLEQIAQMRASGIDVINLGIGSPDLAPDKKVIKAAINSLEKKTTHGYSTHRSLPELRLAIAKWQKNTYHVDLNPNDEILPLLGSKEGILYLSMAFLNSGDGVLVPNPGYPTYTSAANLLNAKIIPYDLKASNSWMPDLDALEKMDLSQCKLMWVNYPHMPTGQKANSEFFKKLVEFAKKKKILICNDNPYGMILNETSPISILSFDPEKLVTCELNSLSKSFNMAGWRVGAFMGSKDLVDAVIKVKSNVDSGMFSAIQAGAIEALSVDEKWHEERNEIYKKRRAHIWEIFDLLGFSYSKEQVGLFIWAEAPQNIPSVVDFLDNVLKEAHVFLTPGMIFGSNGNNYARASLCASEETLEKAKKRIKEFCR
ncbi:MAG: pyridoxal phosphate-dependent aminotransferase [Bacteriovoracaceae bacterium]